MARSCHCAKESLYYIIQTEAKSFKLNESEEKKMAQKTATVYAGEQENGVEDCGAVVSRLLAKGYVGKPYGHDGNLPTKADFADGKNRTFMYWSSHGSSLQTHYRVQGASWFDVKEAMSSWDKSDPCEAMMFASCYAFSKQSFVQHFYESMKSTNVFVICGYGGTAPAGNDTDVKIANKFFDGLDSGLGIVFAWQAANQDYAKSSWGAMSYGTTGANCNFTLPGWGNNSGISRSQPIWCLKQDFGAIYRPSSANANLKIMSAKLPYEITLADATIPMDYSQLGEGHALVGNEQMINYHLPTVEKMDPNEIPGIAAAALKKLNLEQLLNNAEILFAPVTVCEVTDEGMGEEFSIGGDIVYQQRFGGVEIENNFIRICVNKDGVYRLVNKWKPVVASRMATTNVKAKASVDDTIKKLNQEAGVEIQSDTLVYRPNAEGTYKLCRKIEYVDGTRHYIDSLTGEEEVKA